MQSIPMTKPVTITAVHDQIKEYLAELQAREQVKVLFAAESGSRAWGFESPDSDWDVRFVYVRPPMHYLNLQPIRDVIEEMLPNDIDLSGWDLPKALFLFQKSNPSLYEWLNSPIVYCQDDQFVADFQQLIPQYQSLKAGLYHYRSMAKTNFHKFLDQPIVSHKKYLYVLRPILACQYIEKNKKWPPMAFADLVESADLPTNLIVSIHDLLAKKMAGNEMATGPVNPILHEFVLAELERLMQLSLDADANRDQQPLTELLRSTAARMFAI